MEAVVVEEVVAVEVVVEVVVVQVVEEEEDEEGTVRLLAVALLSSACKYDAYVRCIRTRYSACGMRGTLHLRWTCDACM